MLFNDLVPMSKEGQKVVTLHGDWQPENLLTLNDGTMVCTNLESCYVGYCVLDIAYFCIMCELTREQHLEFAKAYLRITNQNKNAIHMDIMDTVVDFMFDIELAKLTTPLVGLLYQEAG